MGTTILSICLFYLPDLLPSFSFRLTQSSSLHLQPTNSTLSQQQTTMSRASTSRTLAKAVKASEQSEGVGATVRRSIGTPALRNLSPFLMLDHFKVGKGAGFSEHPHRGQATITYMLSGAFRHEDHKGHKGTLNPGDVQWMQAGKGIVHSEMPLHEEGKGDPTGMQLWVDLPRAQKMSPPDYQELASSEMPYAHPSEGVTIKVISGVAQGNEKEGEISSPVTLTAAAGTLISRSTLAPLSSKLSQQAGPPLPTFSKAPSSSALAPTRSLSHNTTPASSLPSLTRTVSPSKPSMVQRDSSLSPASRSTSRSSR